MDQLVMIYVTIDTLENAQNLACQLLEKRLVACVNILSAVKSLYIWNDALSKDDEIVLVMKTLASKYNDLEHEILSSHPYQLPCIVKIAAQATQGYLDFVTRAVK